MKFKYKKIILIITMCTMCIGMVTISLTTPSDGKNRKNGNGTNGGDNTFAVMSDDATLMDDAGLSDKKSELKNNDVEEIDALVTTYLKGMLTCDLVTLGDIVTDVESIDIVDMQGKQRLIEQYENIECYTLDGLKEGEYLVYYYNEVKFSGIDTLAPGLNRLYIVTEDDKLKIVTGHLRQEVQDFIEEADESDEVQQIINTVNYKLEQAINEDDGLRQLYANLNGGSDEVDTDAAQDESVETTDVPPTDEPIEDTETVNE